MKSCTRTRAYAGYTKSMDRFLPNDNAFLQALGSSPF